MYITECVRAGGGEEDHNPIMYKDGLGGGLRDQSLYILREGGGLQNDRRGGGGN